MTSIALIHVKAAPLYLSTDTTTEAAFLAIIGACLRHASANQPAVLAGQMEGVHQMRVAFRRLRSGLKIFQSPIPREASAERVEDLRWLNRVLGPARDWDVLLEEGLAPVFSHFPHKRSMILFRKKAEALRQMHHQTLRDALAEARYPALLARFAEWLERRVWRDTASSHQLAQLEKRVPLFAKPLLERAHQRVMKKGKLFAILSAEQRHALRIRIKELGYAVDFFASLYPAATVKAYLSAAARLQDCLGVMNDISVTHRLLDEAGLKPVSAARQVIDGWYGCRQYDHEQLFTEIWRSFSACERPWQD